MDNFKLIYKILRILEKSMDVEELDNSTLSAESLGITQPRWCRLMKILADSGYINGINVWNTMDSTYPRVAIGRIEITLKGLEYLQENTIMKKVANLAKGVIDTVS